MAVVERENSSLALYLPIVRQPSGDSIRQPSDCKLILSLSGYCPPTLYCYRCHFSVVSYDNLPTAETEAFTEWPLLSIFIFLAEKRRHPCTVCAHMFPHMRTDLRRPAFPSHTHTHALWLWLCFSFCLPTSGSLSYS